MIYNDLVKEFTENSRDIHTIPKTKRTHLWFYTYAKNGYIYIENSHFHSPSCSISKPRKIEPNEFDIMCDIYFRRCNGESISKEATASTVSQVYWYGILAEMGL